jgi:hypothetical protein
VRDGHRPLDIGYEHVVDPSTERHVPAAFNSKDPASRNPWFRVGIGSQEAPKTPAPGHEGEHAQDLYQLGNGRA